MDIPQSAINACKTVTFISAGIILSIFIVVGFIALLNGNLVGIAFILIPAAIGVLVYLNGDETCRNQIRNQTTYSFGPGNNNPGINIRLF